MTGATLETDSQQAREAREVCGLPDVMQAESLACSLIRLAEAFILPDHAAQACTSEEAIKPAKPVPLPVTDARTESSQLSIVTSIRNSLYWGGWAGSQQIERLARDHADEDLEIAVQSLSAGKIVSILCEVPDSLTAVFLNPEQFALAFDMVAAKWKRPNPQDFSAEQEDLSSLLVSAINSDTTPDRLRSMVVAFAGKDLAADALVFLAMDTQNEFDVFLLGTGYPYERSSFEEVAVGLRDHAPEVFAEARDIARCLLEEDEYGATTFESRKSGFAVDFINDAKRNARKAQGEFKKSGRLYFPI